AADGQGAGGRGKRPACPAAAGHRRDRSLVVEGTARRVRRVLGLLEPFLEFAIEYLALVRLRRASLPESLFALGRLGVQRAEGGVEVGDRALARRLLVGDHRPYLGVDRELRVTAGALDLECGRHRAEPSIECGALPAPTTHFSSPRSPPRL